MAAPSVSLLYASVLAYTVVGLWDLVELALQLTLLLPSSYFVPGGDGERSAGQFTPKLSAAGQESKCLIRINHELCILPVGHTTGTALWVGETTRGRKLWHDLRKHLQMNPTHAHLEWPVISLGLLS